MLLTQQDQAGMFPERKHEGQDPGNGWSWFRLEIRERFFLQRVLGTAQASQGMDTALRLPELQESLDNMHRVGLLGICAGLGWIDDPFQLRIFCD